MPQRGQREAGGDDADGEPPQGSSAHLDFLLVSGRVPAACREDGDAAWSRVTLRSAKSFLVVVCHGRARRLRLTGPPRLRGVARDVRRTPWPGGCRWRASCSPLQLVIICVVLVGVAAVTVAQSDARAPRDRGPPGARRRRDAGQRPRDARGHGRGRGALPAGSPPRAPAASPAPRRSSSHGPTAGRRHRRPRPADPVWTCRDSTVLQGRSLGGGRGTSTAAAPPSRWRRSSPDDGAESLGVVAVQRPYPGRLDNLAAARRTC